MFFDGTDRVHQAMRKVVEVFDQHRIEYAIVGGMAVNAHGHAPTTDDIDFLVRAQGLVAVRDLVAKGDLKQLAGRPRRFIEPSTGVQFDVLVTGLFPGSGQPGPIAYPDPSDVSQMMKSLRVINLSRLVELKLAARRYKDFADVVGLIRVNNLDESFIPQLHKSVQADFVECLEEKRREDEYERTQDEMSQ